MTKKGSMIMNLLEGVTILDQNPIMTSFFNTVFNNAVVPIFYIVLFFLCALLLSFFCRSLGKYSKATKKTKWILGVLSSISFLALMGFILSLIIIVPTGKMEYKVIIDDNVSFTYMYDHYEIVNQEGSIYTIREKE